MLGTGNLLIAGLCRLICGLYIIELLTCYSVFFQKLLKAVQLFLSVFHLHTCFFYTGIAHVKVVLGGGYTGVSSLLTSQGVGEVGFCLSQTEFELGVFYNEKGIAFMYRLVFIETDFLDEARYTCIYRCDVLTHLCVIGIFYIAQMKEARADINKSTRQQADDDDIINELFYFSSCHNYCLYIL